MGVPIGTVTAIFLTEFAKQDSWFARTVRFAVNTLAGVPSIVFGLFGVGFFIQFVGLGIDGVTGSTHQVRPLQCPAGNRKAANGECIPRRQLFFIATGKDSPASLSE